MTHQTIDTVYLLIKTDKGGQKTVFYGPPMSNAADCWDQAFRYDMEVSGFKVAPGRICQRPRWLDQIHALSRLSGKAGDAMLAAAIALATVVVEMPPARYDHPPEMPIEIRFVSTDRINDICTTFEVETYSCAPPYFQPAACVIYMDERFRSQQLILIRHEQAHCNGWRHPL